MKHGSLEFTSTLANMTYQNFNQQGSVAPSGQVTSSTVLNVSQDDVIRNYPHTKRVGGYLLGRTIGEGSFAKVKEGIHVLTGEKVAIKIIDKKKAKEDAYVRRNMRREGRLLQQVRHRNIVQLFETLETENSYYIVTEHCGGGDLMSRICSRRRLDEIETRKYIRQVVSAVDYLHKAGILHRDLKVENLLLDERKDIKIIDFGLSNSFWSSESTDSPGLADELCVTQCGSPAYAAPELLSNSKYGPKVDIWSIGVNMYAMLTGNLPFTVDPFTIKSLHNKMINGDMNPIPEHLSSNCKDLLKRFLTANPDERISLQEAMQHAWTTDGRNKPIEAAPYPNRLSAVELNQTVLKHMATQLEFKLGEVLRQVTSNLPCSGTATYHLLLRKLQRYRDGLARMGRPAGPPRSETILGLRRTARNVDSAQRQEIHPSDTPPSNATQDDIVLVTHTPPHSDEKGNHEEVTTPPSPKDHHPDPSITLPLFPQQGMVSAPSGRGTAGAASDERPAVGTLPRPKRSSVGRQKENGASHRELVVESISGDEATDEGLEEVVDGKGIVNRGITTVIEKDVGMSEANNDHGDDNDDNNNNDDDNEQNPAVIKHQRIDANTGHLANGSSTPSPKTGNSTSMENKENRVELARTVQPNRSRNRSTDTKYNKLTQINAHASLPSKTSDVTEEALFVLSPQVKGQGYDRSHVTRAPNHRPASDLPQILSSTGHYVTNTWTLSNQRPRPGAQGGSRAVPTSRQPSRTVTGSRSTPSGCGGRISRESDAPIGQFKAEVTSVPAKTTGRRYIIDVDQSERRASRERRTMFFTPRPHQWRVNQGKPLTVSPAGSLTDRRRTRIAGRTGSTEEDGVGKGRTREGTAGDRGRIMVGTMGEDSVGRGRVREGTAEDRG